MIGKGTTFGHSGIPATTYTPIGKVADINKPGVSWDDVETTHYGTANGIKSFMAGWAEGDVVEVDINHDSSEETAIRALGGLDKTWKITLAGGPANYTFQGYVNKVGGSIPNKEQVKTTLSIKVNTIPVFDDGV